MKMICAWCGKDMGEIPEWTDERIVKGVCEVCAKVKLKRMKEEQKEEERRQKNDN